MAATGKNEIQIWMPQREIEVDLSGDKGEGIGMLNVLANSVEQPSSEQ